jgi:hypothetical protein
MHARSPAIRIGLRWSSTGRRRKPQSATHLTSVILTTKGRKDLPRDLSLRFFLPLVVRMMGERLVVAIPSCNQL